MTVGDRDWAKDDSPETSPSIPPLSIAESAVAMHELYSSYIAAGFTVDQAMRLLTTWLAAAVSGLK